MYTDWDILEMSHFNYIYSLLINKKNPNRIKLSFQSSLIPYSMKSDKPKSLFSGSRNSFVKL